MVSSERNDSKTSMCWFSTGGSNLGKAQEMYILEKVLENKGFIINTIQFVLLFLLIILLQIQLLLAIHNHQ